ncbi:MAG: sugar kinase [Haloarculaceae archaeon]
MSGLVTFGETPLRLSPPDDERIEMATRFRLETSGTESNVAITASRLGTTSAWVSRLPESPLGRRVVAEVRRHGVETDIEWTDEGRQGLVFHESGSELRADRAVHDRDDATAGAATPESLALDRFRAADVAFVAGSTVALSKTAAETATAVLEAATDGGALTAMDVDHQPGLWNPDANAERLQRAFAAVDVLFANEREFETVLGRSGKPREQVHTVASKGDFEMVVMTRSEYGAIVWHDNVVHERDSVPTADVDASGQHAAFVGGFLDRLAGGADADEALSHGVATAALARTIPGTAAAVEPDEVERVLARME